MSTEEICALISQSGFIPVERDSLYKAIDPKLPVMGTNN